MSEGIDHFPFIIGAYGAAVLGLVGLVVDSLMARRRAKRAVEQERARDTARAQAAAERPANSGESQ